jgi:hypothetical protein
LLAKADDPQVKIKLASLTTPGYLQYQTIDVIKKPVSLSVLQAAGAFNQTKEGMNALVYFVNSRQDKVRPRMSLQFNRWFYDPQQIQQVTDLQNLLIELRPVLVEKGMLAP